MSAIIPFQFDAHAVRVQVDDLGLPLFNANDVCSALEFTNPHKAVADHVDADDPTKREVIDTLGRSAKCTNRLLAGHGLQFRNDRDEWELTEAGETWAEAMPYSRNGHSGYQILWNPAVAEQIREAA